MLGFRLENVAYDRSGGRRGVRVDIGTHSELLAKRGVYANLYRMTYEQAPTVDGDGLAPAPQPAG